MTKKILLACEFSGIVREAFRRRGFDAYSCDLLPTDIKGKHYQDDIYNVLKKEKWSAVIAFTPCTYSCLSGIRWLIKDGVVNSERYEKLKYYAGMLRDILQSNVKKVACENPIPHRFAIEIIGRKYDQIIQPYQFGHGEQKSICLWLKNLPRLSPTNIVLEREQKVWKMPPSPDRWKNRSRFYNGIAEAMADQWGKVI